MAVHKVPLDVEADDKFLGPLSFKQFLFGGGALVFGYVTFLTFTKGLWPISFIFLFPTLLGAIFAFPWSKEQPSELFLASRIRFYLKPRKRIWDQSGMKHLVQVTVPKQIVHEMTDGLNPTEVRSRFNALATMVDSRGWAVKHAGVDSGQASDRLITPDTSMPTDKQAVLQSTPDVLDENNSTIARQFDTMIQQSTAHQKSAARDIVEKARQDQTASLPAAQPTDNNQDFWFKEQANAAIQPANKVVMPTTQQAQPVQSNDTALQLSEEELLEKAHEAQRRNAMQTGTKHGMTVNPDGSIMQSGEKLSDKPVAGTTNTTADNAVDDTSDNATAQNQPAPVIQQDTQVTQANDPIGQNQTTQSNQQPQTTPPYVAPTTQHSQYQAPEEPVTKKRNPDILELAQSNDLNIETLARQSHKNDDGEVVISLH